MADFRNRITKRLRTVTHNRIPSVLPLVGMFPHISLCGETAHLQYTSSFQSRFVSRKRLIQKFESGVFTNFSIMLTCFSHADEWDV